MEGLQMNEKLSNHIQMLFEKAPKTRKALELKEELLVNSEERYQDLIAGGISSEDAIKNVIISIGNVSELFQGLEDSNPELNGDNDARIKKSAIIKTIAAGIYIFSVVVLFTFVFIDSIIHRSTGFLEGLPGSDPINYTMVGIILMILIDIIPTCMLVYITSMYPNYRKQEDTLVEDFKEWKNDNIKKKSVKGAVSLVLWTSTILLYFALSFATFAWYATWIIFLAALCIQTIIELLFRLKEIRG